MASAFPSHPVRSRELTWHADDIDRDPPGDLGAAEPGSNQAEVTLR
jgi:hypothetical protein